MLILKGMGDFLKMLFKRSGENMEQTVESQREEGGGCMGRD